MSDKERNEIALKWYETGKREGASMMLSQIQKILGIESLILKVDMIHDRLDSLEHAEYD